MNIKEILLATGMTEHDADKHIKEGVEVVPVTEMIELLNTYPEYSGYDDEDAAELKESLKLGKDGRIGDADIVTYNNIQYFVTYCL